MAEKNIQIKNQTGDLLYPKTKASVVINNGGDNLGTVEAGAQVNKIEKIKVNGTEISIVSKEVDITIPAQSEYAISKLETADDGFAATYQLTKDNVAFGQKINIPKDMVVSAGEVKKATTANTPVNGLAKGDPYIELTIANNDGTKLYIPVKDLVDVYTEGNGIKIENNQVAIDTEVVVVKSDLSGYQASLSADQLNAVNSGITADKLSALETHKAATDIHVTAEDKTNWNNKLNVGDVYSKTEVDGAISALNALTYVELA